MTQSEYNDLCEFRSITTKAIEIEHNTGAEGSFIVFLRYCSERLNKGDSVQVIWHDYQASIQKKLP